MHKVLRSEQISKTLKNSQNQNMNKFGTEPCYLVTTTISWLCVKMLFNVEIYKSYTYFVLLSSFSLFGYV